MIPSDQGRLFEVGFNLGMLAFLETHQFAPEWVNFYRCDLQQLKFSQILPRLIAQANTISSLDEQIIKNWGQLLIFKGFVGGRNFLHEYFQAFGWDEPRKLKNIEVLYYQCSFTDDNSFHTSPKGEVLASTLLLTQFKKFVKEPMKEEINSYVQKYQKKGEFLKADTLIFLRYQQEYRILAVDLSVFSLHTGNSLTNLEFVTLFKRQLIREINYLRSKSVFSRLRIDTSDEDFSFTAGLRQYFTAFKYEDKESSKLIQAGSYAHSFTNFLQEIGFFPEKLLVSVVGYSDRGLSTITLNRNNLPLLHTCQEIYQANSSIQEINSARKEVLNLIKRQAFRSFEGGKKFVDSLFAIEPNQITQLSHKEKLTGFANTVNLRQQQAELIHQALVSEDTYVFLTGSPGIGKTTAIANFLQAHFNEGFLFFYASPRKQVNIDLIDKFKKNSCLFCLNTNSHLTSNNSTYTVQYLSEKKQGTFTCKGVTFWDAREKQLPSQSHNDFQRKTEDLIQPATSQNKGVIASISQAIYGLIEENISNQIIASVCIQALQKTRGGDTLENFGKIFQGAYNKRIQQVIPNKMREISQRYKHFFIMIDEITGDESGVEFLKGIRKIMQQYKLAEYGFNAKIIVADASIVDKNVIKQHLQDSDPEPDKIFFRKAKSSGVAISAEQFEFNGLAGRVINANSYPAKSLTITYKVIVNSYQVQADTELKQQKDYLVQNIQKEIIQDLEKIWSEEEQILIYIQNKKRLQELIKEFRKNRGEFKKDEDYLEVHANISENERQEIQNLKNKVKIIFMTSSGSRGLSFPRVKSILVDIPRFHLEKNLMEIIQVIYRGRGEKELDQQDKQLIFYLGERVAYYDDENAQISLQESLLNILNILLILKASMMTRIEGVGILGREQVMMIPVGGKSSSLTGESFSMRMANLLRELKQEAKIKPEDIRLKKVYENLKQLLGEADFILSPSSTKELSYLKLGEQIEKQFLQVINKGFDGLLKLGNLETGNIAGSLMIVPTGEKKLVENYLIKLDNLMKIYPELLKDLMVITKASKYNDNLRYAVKDAIALIDKLKEQQEKSQKIEHHSQRLDQYYAIPLFTFLNREVLREYFTTQVEEEGEMFRDILEAYIRCLYSVDNVLPLGEKYEEIPFIVFNSYSLAEIRDKVFTDRYLLNSHELNVLNLILSQQE
ncbi:MAG: helicase [Gomphosphaeria aponina SAG 52.96 = DSM 107014]|uniref:Helicase n=1 Tax=Gomphosphaeria aponina SAG 52.96 = DSM 107014 TaxID=1521640 RepID=A0A941GZ88_9CHRO|nr:helicase [Gomphosphaeria aponina SAG 52.96 = DSM 107014]